MSTTISLANLRKEHARIKTEIAKGTIKIIHYGSASDFLKSLQKIE
ncbi:MAG: hypothetical protein WD154_02845 [Nitrosopumilaceae archaeon]